MTDINVMNTQRTTASMSDEVSCIDGYTRSPLNDPLLQTRQTLLPDRSLPRFKPVAEKLKAFPGLAAVAGMRFVRM